MRDVEHLVGDGVGLAEELVRFVGVDGNPRPRRVDGGIDVDVGDMYALGPEIARQRLGENPLCRLGRREGWSSSKSPALSD